MSESIKSPELSMQQVRESKKRPDALVHMPSDAHFENLCIHDKEDCDLPSLKSKYTSIAREVVSRMIFPMLEENIEKKSAEMAGISTEQLEKIRKAMEELEPNHEQKFDDQVDTTLTEVVPEMEKDKFGTLIDLIEVSTNPVVQKTILSVIEEQISQLTPYFLERAKLEYDLERKQLIDTKTGALNHEGIKKRFRAEAIKLNTVSSKEEEGKDEKHLLLFEFDIDNFKQINDDPSRGHDVGDDILKEIVRNIKKALRPDDTVGRRGGDEFTIIINDVNEKGVDKMKAKILNAIEIISDRAGGNINITGAVRKIQHGERTTYKQASEQADVAAAIAKVLDKGKLVDFPLNTTIDSDNETEKLQFAEAIVKRRTKREKNLYRQKMENEEDPKKTEALRKILKLIGKRINTDIEIELQKMEARIGIYEDILT